MATVPTTQGRELPFPGIAYISKNVAFNTTGIATVQTVEVGHLPPGAVVTNALTVVTTAFNASTTNVLIVGTGASNNEFFDASTSGSTVTEGTTGGYQSAVALGYTVGANGEVVYANYTQSGTAATTGAATIIISYASRIG